MGNVTTLAGYLVLLEEAGLLSGLQKFARDTARKYQSMPKFQVHNAALRTVYTDCSFDDALASSQRWGRFVESAVGAYLVSQATLCDYRVYYWRERNDEVDFVLTRRDKVVAIEVKSGRRSMNSGLKLFAEHYHPYHTLVVGTEGIDFETFFKMDLRMLFS